MRDQELASSLRRVADLLTPEDPSNDWYVWIETWEDTGNPSFTIKFMTHGVTRDEAVEMALGMLELLPNYRVGEIYAVRKEHVHMVERWNVQRTPQHRLRT